MASLQHDDAVRYLARRWAGRAALLALALAAACGGDRNRAAGGDTAGAAVVKPDSAAMPVTDTAAPAAVDSARSAATDTSTKPATAPAAPAKTAPPTPTVTRQPAASTDTGTKAAAAPAQQPKPAAAAAAPAPAAAPGGQDTSKATAVADAPLRDEYHQAPRDTVSQAVYNGWKQYNLNCARCHGEDALGTTIAPHLIVSMKPSGTINTKELFVQVVCAGRPEKGMPAWCALGLEMDKISDIYEYVKGRSDAKISPGRPAVKQQG
jgi:hypothetical protein